MEIDQFMDAKIAEKKATKQSLLHGSPSKIFPSPPEKRETAKSSSANLLKWFSKYFRYILSQAEDEGANRNQLCKFFSTATNDPAADFFDEKKNRVFVDSLRDVNYRLWSQLGC